VYVPAVLGEMAYIELQRRPLHWDCIREPDVPLPVRLTNCFTYEVFDFLPARYRDTTPTTSLSKRFVSGWRQPLPMPMSARHGAQA